jgi:fumarate reductase subunit D
MTPLKIWNYLNVGSLVLASTMFALLLLSDHSYGLMQWLFTVGGSIAAILISITILCLITLPFSGLARRKKWKQAIIGLAILILSTVVLLAIALTNYQVTTRASFDRQTYYLVKFLQIDSYTYRVYRCGAFDLFCHRSTGYIGIPNQHISIRFQQDLKTKKVYIQNGDRAIEIPD